MLGVSDLTPLPGQDDVFWLIQTIDPLFFQPGLIVARQDGILSLLSVAWPERAL